MSKKIALWLSLFMLFSSIVSAADTAFSSEDGDVTEIYVSADGSDDADGSKSSPFRTLERARDAVRELNDDMTGDIVVHVGDGVHTLDETFVLTSEDSGTNGYQVIYKGEGREATVISGGVAVDGWELHDAEKGIYRASVPADADFRQLYVNGERAIRARSGKLGNYSTRIVGAERIKDGEVLPELLSVDNASSRAQADDGTIFIAKKDGTLDPAWGNINDVELHVFTAWSVNILRIKSVAEDGDNYSIKVADEEAELVFNRQHPNIDGYSHMSTRNFIYYVENAYELIDLDGEWYLDTDADVLYYKAPEGVDPNSAEIVFPSLETLVHVTGTLESPVENVVFTDIGFMYSSWTKPSEEGFVDGQAMQYVTRTTFGTNDVGVGRPAAGILVEAADGIIFDGNKIANMGATGIDFHFGVTNSIIANSLVTDISGNGIAVGKFAKNDTVDYHEPYNPEDGHEICVGDMIVNNEIYRVGRDYECAVAVAAGYPKDLLIANNTIAYAPYSGISVGFGWTKSENAMAGNRIIRNEIHHVTEVLCDAGGIYTLSKQPDSEMWGNYIHDITLPSWADYGTSGIYLDEGTDGYYITQNVVEKAYGINPHIAGYNTIAGNFVNEKSVVKGDEASAVKKNAGVQDSIDLATLENVPTVEDSLPDLDYVEVFGDDFESYDEGRLVSDSWTVQKKQRDLVEVATVVGNKLIKLTSNNENTKLYANLTVGANVTQFDFCFAQALTSYDGMYNVVRDSGTIYTANLNPAYNPTVRLEIKGANDIGIFKEMDYKTWYTCKTMVYENNMCVKVWPKGEAEPAEWDVIREMNDPVNGDAVVGLEFYSTGTKSMYVDNVKVYALSEKTEPDTPVTEPADTDAPDTDEDTSVVTDEAPTEEPDGGCGSAVASALIIIITAFGAALIKKK